MSSAPPRNFRSRTLFQGDNLEFLRGMNTGTVQLIATDPPFNKKRDFHAMRGSPASGTKWVDRWSWDHDVHPDWVDSIQDDWPRVWRVIDAAIAARNDEMGAFLCWLGVRLMEMRRVLAEDGTIYVHIDHTAHAYVKALMDAIFGWKNFRNEIVWCYRGGGHSKRDFPRKHDSILRYSKGEQWTFHPEFVAYGPHNTTGRRATDRGGTRPIDYNPKGTPVVDWWDDIPALINWHKEKKSVGYGTQKPVDLYARIIRASSNPGDIVLDPFAGCATTIVAAERLGRGWVGIDTWEEAGEMVKDRLQNDETLLTADGGTDRLLSFGDLEFSDVPPIRTDECDVAAPKLELKNVRRDDPWVNLSRSEIKVLLADAQSRDNRRVVCGGCGRALEIEFMEIDHITPRSSRGENHILNRVILCRPCNGRKSDKLTLKGLVDENRKTGWTEDESEGSWAQVASQERAEWVRDNHGSEEYSALVRKLQRSALSGH